MDRGSPMALRNDAVALTCRCVLAEMLRKPILVLCFNISLAARLRAFIAERGLEGRVNLHHFHEWCGEQLRTYHVEVADTGGQQWVRQVEAVIQGVDAGCIPLAQYGAIMIDEGHDFEREWLKLVTQMVDPSTDSLLLLYDDAQSIYRKSRGLDFSLSSVGIKAAGRTSILRLNYRNTREILQFACEFASKFMGAKAADDDHIPMIQPETGGASGPGPDFRQFASIGDEIAYATRCIKAWHERGDFLGDIAVICIGLGQIETSETQAAQNMKLLYVGMTRAKERLLITASGRNEFTEKLEAMTGVVCAVA